jgi:hypothetical protein
VPFVHAVGFIPHAVPPSPASPPEELPDDEPEDEPEELPDELLASPASEPPDEEPEELPDELPEDEPDELLDMPEELPDDEPDELLDTPEELPDDEPDELPEELLPSSVESVPESPVPPVLELPPQPVMLAATVHPVSEPMRIHFLKEPWLGIRPSVRVASRPCRPPGDYRSCVRRRSALSTPRSRLCPPAGDVNPLRDFDRAPTRTLNAGCSGGPPSRQLSRVG